MTKDEIIELAVKAGFSLNELNKEDDSDHIWYEVNFTDLLLDLREFSKLVAAAEREACAESCNRWIINRYDINLLPQAIRGRGQE